MRCGALTFLLVAGLSLSAGRRSLRVIRRIGINKEEVNKNTETGLLVASEANWEKFIAPAPQIVYLLGSLMVVSTAADFSLEAAKPPKGFEYMKSPQSFRATLIQVTNECYGAFSNAHTNMDKVFLNMGQISTNLKTALKILDRGSTRIIQNLFPIPIETIFDIAKQSAEAAKETETKFDTVMLLIGEVIRSVGVVKPMAEQELRNVNQSLQTQQMVLARMEERDVILQKRMKKLEEDVERYQDEYDEYMDDIPTGWNAVMLGFGHAVVGMVDRFGETFTGLFGGGGGAGGGGGGGSNVPAPADQIEGLADQALIDGIMMGFTSTMESIYVKLTQIFKDKAFAPVDDPLKAFNAFKQTFNANLKQIRESGGTRIENTKEPLKILSDGVALTETAIDAFSDPQHFPSNDTSNQIMAEIQRLIRESKPYSLPKKARKAVGQQGGQGNANSDLGDPDDPFYNERFKTSQALTLLMHAKDRSDRFFTEYNAFQDKMTELMTEIKSLDFKQINYQKIIEIMRKGMDVLTQVRLEWSKLVRFFQMISNRASMLSEITLKPFLKITEKLQQMENITEKEKFQFLWILVEKAVEVERVSLFLKTVAGTYIEISEKYIVHALAGLPRLLSVDEGKRQEMVTKLEQDGKEGQKYISDLAKKHRKEFEAMLDQRIKAMTAKLENYADLDELE